MTHIILTGHGHFASGLASALEMVAGDLEAFTVVEFTQDDAQTYPDKLSSVIDSGLSSEGSVLVFCDLKGGTPFNCSMLSAVKNEHIEVVGGINLPILIETVMMRGADASRTAADLAEIAITASKTAITRDNKASLEGAQNRTTSNRQSATSVDDSSSLDAPDDEGI